MAKEIPIICPNCGAHAYYPEGGHVAVCPYCEGVVVADDAESEIKLDNLQKEADLLKDRAKRREALDKNAAEYARRLKTWQNCLRALLVFVFFAVAVAFLIFGNEEFEGNSALETPAALLFLAAATLGFVCPPILGASKPRSGTAPENGAPSAASTLAATLKLYGYCFASALCGAFLSYVIYTVFF